MEKSDLENLHEMLPGTVSMSLVPVGADSTFDSAVNVTAAEKRPLRLEERQMAGIELETKATRIHLWVSTFSSPVEVKRHDLIREEDGTEWVVVTAMLEMMDTRWGCNCVQNFQGPS